MTLDDVIADLADTEGQLPVDAIEWATEHWEEARPRFLALLEAAADGKELSEAERNALFFVVHLLAEQGEEAAFAPLVRFLHRPDDLQPLLGDAVVSTLPGVLISTFDGDLAALQGLVVSPAADAFARTAAIQAAAYLMRKGDQSEARAWLRRLGEEMQPRGESYVWNAWALVAAELGYEELRPQIQAAFDDRRIDEVWTDMEEIDEILAEARESGGRLSAVDGNEVLPFVDTIGTFADWHNFTPEYLEEKAERQRRIDAGEDPDADDFDLLGGDDEDGLDEDGFPYRAEPSAPVVNPYKDVGRNDPCPCGSGKKFKKCCLGKAA